MVHGGVGRAGKPFNRCWLPMNIPRQPSHLPRLPTHPPLRNDPRGRKSSRQQNQYPDERMSQETAAQEHGTKPPFGQHGGPVQHIILRRWTILSRKKFPGRRLLPAVSCNGIISCGACARFLLRGVNVSGTLRVPSAMPCSASTDGTRSVPDTLVRPIRVGLVQGFTGGGNCLHGHDPA